MYGLGFALRNGGRSHAPRQARGGGSAGCHDGGGMPPLGGNGGAHAPALLYDGKLLLRLLRPRHAANAQRGIARNHYALRGGVYPRPARQLRIDGAEQDGHGAQLDGAQLRPPPRQPLPHARHGPHRPTAAPAPRGQARLPRVAHLARRRRGRPTKPGQQHAAAHRGRRVYPAAARRYHAAPLQPPANGVRH